MKNLKCAWCRITVCAMASIALAGCTKNEISAPISSSLGGNIHASSYNGKGPDKRASKSVEPYALAAISSGTQVKTSTKRSLIETKRYNTIPTGSYAGTAYQVQWSDTLFYIAWITGNDYRDLGYNTYRNNISKPYNLNLDHTLQVGTITTSITDNAPSGLSSNAIESLLKQSLTKMFPTTAVTTITTTPAAITTTGNKAIIGWRWPTDGKIIDNFSAAEGGNKGVDISGSRGQPILATASGRVVYAGNALRGYGNLIIIKHNDNYLSAYAHNDMLLVHEQQKVKAGQKISTMGSTGTSTTRLHFEIHYKGRSVNPLRYLPQR